MGGILKIMKKIPQRSCVACKQKKDKNKLIRIVKSKENEIIIDETGKKPGKGAYICDSIECLEKIKKNKALDRALEITIYDDFLEKLREKIIGGDVIG